MILLSLLLKLQLPVTAYEKRLKSIVLSIICVRRCRGVELKHFAFTFVVAINFSRQRGTGA